MGCAGSDEHRGFVRKFAIMLLAASALPASAWAQCVKGTRDVGIGSAVAKFASYLCQASPDGPQVSIQFLRLSDAAAAGVIRGQLWPEVNGYLGNVRLHETPVTAEVRDLFDRFGQTHDREDAYYVQAFAPKAGRSTQKESAGTGIKRLTYLAYPDTQHMTMEPIALPEADVTVKSGRSWPDGFRFYYGLPGEVANEVARCDKPDDFHCIILWRPLNADDVSQFEDRFQRHERMLRTEEAPEISDTPVDLEPIKTPGSEPLPLISYLTKGGWPDDFITVVGTYSACGGGYDFSYYPRPMVLDAAIIENGSSGPLSIGEILGAAAGGGLRAPLASRDAAPASGAIGTLAPGEKVLVPLRINFVVPEGLKDAFATPMDKARAFYSRIDRLPAGTIIEEQPTEWMNVLENPLRKKKEGYRPPERPAMGSLVFGPEIVMNGLMVDGARVLLQETSSNFLELTAGEGYGSCPYLYVLDSGTGRWVNYGKVIHEADTPLKETTEEVRLHTLATRFRIAEEELEISQINRVMLLLDLRKSQTLRLEPDLAALKAADKDYVAIAAGKALEFSFALPAGVREADVAAARLMITGYYRRYSSMSISGLSPN